VQGYAASSDSGVVVTMTIAIRGPGEIGEETVAWNFGMVMLVDYVIIW
jgi:hypothetical protein